MPFPYATAASDHCLHDHVKMCIMPSHTSDMCSKSWFGDIISCCRELESRVEGVAQQALGSRAKQVRVLRARLGACEQLAEGIPAGAGRRCEILLAAQVRSCRLLCGFLMQVQHAPAGGPRTAPCCGVGQPAAGQTCS